MLPHLNQERNIRLSNTVYTVWQGVGFFTGRNIIMDYGLHNNKNPNMQLFTSKDGLESFQLLKDSSAILSIAIFSHLKLYKWHVLGIL